MGNVPVYVVWDFWSDKEGCYAIYEKEEEKKLYFSEVTKEESEEIKLLEDKKLRKRLFWRFIKKLFKRKDK